MLIKEHNEIIRNSARNFKNLEILLPRASEEETSAYPNSGQVLTELLEYLSPLSPVLSSEVVSAVDAISDEELAKALEADVQASKLYLAPKLDGVILFEIPGYVCYKRIGKGAFADVYMGKHVATNEAVAVKRLKKKLLESASATDRVLREIMVHKQLHHKNIVELYEVLHGQEYIDLIMEHCDEGELFEFVDKTNQGLTEVQARFFFKQLVSAIGYCHSKQVAHRDLKLENILLTKEMEVKIIDFGLTNVYTKDKMLKTQCGSPEYSAPELLTGNPYNAEMTDIWALGVILYGMIYGELPFSSEKLSKTFGKIARGDFTFPKRKQVSAELKDLISRILTVDAQKRISLKEISEHPWLNFETKFIMDIEELHVKAENFNKIQRELVSFGFTKQEIERCIEENEPSQVYAALRLLNKKYHRPDKNVRLMPQEIAMLDNH